MFVLSIFFTSLLSINPCDIHDTIANEIVLISGREREKKERVRPADQSPSNNRIRYFMKYRDAAQSLHFAGIRNWAACRSPYTIRATLLPSRDECDSFSRSRRRYGIFVSDYRETRSYLYSLRRHGRGSPTDLPFQIFISAITREVVTVVGLTDTRQLRVKLYERKYGPQKTIQAGVSGRRIPSRN